MKVTVATIEHFRSAASFLKESEGAIMECFEDPEFRRGLATATHTVDNMARILGEIECSISGK